MKLKLRRILVLLLLLAPLLTVSHFDEVRSQPYFEQLDILLEGNRGPDVGFVDELRLPYYAANGFAQPLPPDLVSDDFYPQLLRQFQLEGTTYAVPQSFTTAALMVNLTAFNDAGIDIPQWWGPIEKEGVELVAAAQELQNAQHEFGNPDFYALGLTPEFTNWLPFFFQAGGELYAQPETLGVNSDAGNVALNLWVELMNQGLVDTSPVEDWPYDVQNRLLDQFVQGNIGMMLVGGIHFDKVLGEERDFDVQVIELPAGPVRKATVAYVRGYAVYRPNPSAGSLSLLQFLTSPQAMQETWMGNPMYIPPRPSLRETWENTYPEHRAFMAGVDYAVPLNLPPVAWADLEKFDRAAAEVLYSAMIGEMDVPSALGQIDEQAAEYLK